MPIGIAFCREETRDLGGQATQALAPQARLWDYFSSQAHFTGQMVWAGSKYSPFT